MTTHNELANREWVGELKEQMGKMIEEVPESATLDPVPLDVITSFSTHFAEWEMKGSDVLVHIFPRAGEDDQWVEAHYLPRCRNCKSEVPMPERLSQMKPCDRCGHSGLVYVPGRAERADEVAFPENMRDVLVEAADKMWAGSVAIEPVSVLRYDDGADIARDEPTEADLGAFVIQFQNARNTAKLLDPGHFVDKFCEAVDELLDT